jgi:hypothetical protein
MKQKLVTNTESCWRFDEEVNKLLKEGWKVVPGTLLCVISPHEFTHKIHERWAVVVEKTGL